MKNKGFTLIELLAVIIILGILMLIAIPSVTSYINNSRKQSYVSTIKELIKGASNLANSDKLDLSDQDTTYYIPSSAISFENGKAQSPYGELDEAYVIVTYDGQKYNYYFIGKDTADMGIDKISKAENISIESIKECDDVIEPDKAIDRRNKVVVFNEDLTIKSSDDANGKVDGETGIIKKFACKKAKTLHQTTCVASKQGGCIQAGYTESNKGTTITYGTITQDEILPGDAFDCDVDYNGTFDPTTERFYYVSSSIRNGKEVASLIYFDVYKNYYYASDSDLQSIDDYNGYGKNVYGPISAYKRLPSIEEWDNPLLLKEYESNIVNVAGTKTVRGSNGKNIVDSFKYTGRSARLLTYEEIKFACNFENSYYENYLYSCIYFLENTHFEDWNSLNYHYILLETPYDDAGKCLAINDSKSKLDNRNVGNVMSIKPVIDVYVDDIDY